MTTSITERATALYAAIRDNTDDYFSGVRTHDEFGAKNRELWDVVAAGGLRDEVLSLWRANAYGGDCDHLQFGADAGAPQ